MAAQGLATETAPAAGLGSPPEPGYKPREKRSAYMHMTKLAKIRQWRACRQRRLDELDGVLDRACARVLSLGGGVQSTACLLKFYRLYDYVVFADTGSEWPHTYSYLDDYIKPFCAEKNLPLITLKSRRGPLEEHCREKKVIPTRLRRWCTTDWKVEPCRAWYKSIGATTETPVVVDLGISYDEYFRAARNPKVSYEFRNYPLADSGVTREQCKVLIAEHGWPVPGKSSCDFCPYVKDSEFRRLLAADPDRFKVIMELEENGKDFPRTFLRHKAPLRELWRTAGPGASAADRAASLASSGLAESEAEAVDVDHCTSGHCFT